MRKARTAAALTVALIASVTAQAGPAHAAKHRVLAVPRDFPTIQTAVDAASPGDTIDVGPGTYAEQVVLDKDVELHGAGATSTVIKAPVTMTAYGRDTRDDRPLAAIVQVGRGASVRMSGLGVSGPVPCTVVAEGVGVVQQARLEVSDVRVAGLIAPGCSGEAYGIVFGVSPSYAVEDVPGGTTASGRVSHVTVDTYQSGGIVVVGAYGQAPSRVTLTDNTVLAGKPVDPADQVGIWVRLNAVGQIVGNTVSGGVCTYDGCGFDPIAQYQAIGAVVESADGSVVSGNRVAHTDVGLFDNAANITVSGNTFDNDTIGLVVFDVDGVTKGNTITGGRVGIGVAAATHDASELSSGDRISGVSGSTTQTFECCGYHATVTAKP